MLSRAVRLEVRCHAPRSLRLVPEVRGEPALGLVERYPLAPGVVGHLVAAEAADDEDREAGGAGDPVSSRAKRRSFVSVEARFGGGDDDLDRLVERVLFLGAVRESTGVFQLRSLRISPASSNLS